MIDMTDTNIKRPDIEKIRLHLNHFLERLSPSDSLMDMGTGEEYVSFADIIGLVDYVKHLERDGGMIP